MDHWRRRLLIAVGALTLLAVGSACGASDRVPEPKTQAEKYEQWIEDINAQRNPKRLDDRKEVFEGVRFPPNAANGNANSGGPKPVGYISFQPTFLPLTISIDSDWNFTVSAEQRIHTALGTVEFSAGGYVTTTDKKSINSENLNATILVVCHEERPKKDCEAFEIGTSRRLEFSADGAIKGTVEHDLVELTALPDTTITVTDKGVPAKPQSQRVDFEHFYLWDQSKEFEIDLERRQSGTTADLRYDRMAQGVKLKPINGAKVYTYGVHTGTDGGVRYNADGKQFTTPIDTPKYPTHFPGPDECGDETKPWRDSFDPEDMKWGMILACIITAEKDLGYVLIAPLDTKPTSYHLFTYTWVY